MATSIVTNVASLGAQRNLATTQSALAKSVQRLSSGLRVNTASDDAAGLAIAARLNARIRAMAVAQRNSSDAVSMIQTAESALGEIGSMLTRMRELAVQAANGGTLGTSERASIDNEFQALKSEVNRVTAVTEFNGSKLLNGDLTAGVTFQVGITNTTNDTIETTVFSSATAGNLGVSNTILTSAGGARTAIGLLDTAISTIASRRGNQGAIQNRLEKVISVLAAMQEAGAEAHSRIMDADVATETANLTRQQILMQAGIAVLSQANQMPQVALRLLQG